MSKNAWALDLVAEFEFNQKVWGVLEDRWLFDNIVREVGYETSTLFLKDLWIGELPLEVRFIRLFELVDNKLVYVSEMHFLKWVLMGMHGSGE